MEKKELIKKILIGARQLSLATVNHGEPQVALMQFVSSFNSEGIPKIYFKSFKNSRKNSNIMNNSKVSVCVYLKPEYLQMQGNCEKLNDTIEIEKVKKKFLEKYNDMDLNYLNSLDIEYFVISLNWIRLRTSNEYPFAFEVVYEE